MMNEAYRPHTLRRMFRHYWVYLAQQGYTTKQRVRPIPPEWRATDGRAGWPNTRFTLTRGACCKFHGPYWTTRAAEEVAEQLNHNGTT